MQEYRRSLVRLKYRSNIFLLLEGLTLFRNKRSLINSKATRSSSNKRSFYEISTYTQKSSINLAIPVISMAISPTDSKLAVYSVRDVNVMTLVGK